MTMRRRTTALLFAVVVGSAVNLSTSRVVLATELACVSGHNTVVPPCSFDSGVLSLDSASSVEFGSGGGHHTLANFSGPTITIEADVADGFPAYNSNDGVGGVSTGTLTLT